MFWLSAWLQLTGSQLNGLQLTGSELGCSADVELCCRTWCTKPTVDSVLLTTTLIALDIKAGAFLDGVGSCLSYFG